MAESVRTDVANKLVTRPGEDPEIASRYIGSPKGQIEVMDTSGWGNTDSKSVNPDCDVWGR